MLYAQGSSIKDVACTVRGASGLLIALLCSILCGCSALNSNNKNNPSPADDPKASLNWSQVKSADKRLPKGITSVAQPVPMLPAPRLVMTPEVQAELNSFLGRERNFLAMSLERRERYLPIIEQIFADEGVPEELLALALIESGYNAEARSPVGAVGMWQFMRSTARMYGLKVQRNEDQRKDVILSTLAAARHLRDLYFEHGDWHLALAAYNAGSGGVARALARAGCDDYWTLVRKRKLTVQTQRFVPRIIAAALIARGVKSGSSLTQLASDLVTRDDKKRKNAVELADWSGHRRTSAG